MTIQLDGETIVSEALRSMRRGDNGSRSRRSEAPAAPEVRADAPNAQAAAARETRGPRIPAGLEARITEQAIRTRRALPELIARTQGAAETPETADASRAEFFQATLDLRRDLQREVRSFVEESGGSTTRSEIDDAGRSLQIEIKTVAAEVSGVDAIAEALGGVFDEFLSGLRGLLGVAIDALTAEDGADPESSDGTANVASESAPAAPSTIASAFNIAIPASELSAATAEAAPSAVAETGASAAPAFSISSGPLEGAAEAVLAATAASEIAAPEEAGEVSQPEPSALDTLFDRLRERFASFQASFFGSGGSPFGIQVYSETLNLTLDAADREVDATA